AEALERIEFEHLAMDDAVEILVGHRGSAEGEAMPDLGDEVVLHQPTADEFGLGQDAPYLLRRMVKVVVDEDRPRRGHRLVHHFNSLSRSSMRPSRSRQKSSWRETQSISGASFLGSAR